MTEKKQAGPIRVGGIVGLLATSGALAAVGFMFAEPMAKSLITSGLEKAFKAEANIESVDLELMPLGIQIRGLQQTDADNPANNLFQFANASAKVDFWELLLGNVLIEELVLDELKFNQVRRSPGKLIVKSETEKVANAPKAESSVEEVNAGIEVPSADELLAKADLITEEKAQALESTWKTEREALKQDIDNLPSKATLKKYEAQWKEIEQTQIKSLEDLELLKVRIDALRAAIKQDKNAVKALKQQYKLSKAKLDKAYKELKAAPDQDWQNIKAKLPIEDPNAVAISKLIFGDEVTSYLVKAEEYYQVIKPFLDASKEVKAQDKITAEEAETGRFIDFPLQNPWPTWMVKSLLVNIESPGNQKYRVTGQEINTQHYVRNKASQYSIELVSNSDEMFVLNGTYTISEDSKLESKGQWQASGIQVKDKQLTDSSDLMIRMSKASVVGNGDYTWKGELTNQNQVSFSDVDIEGQANTKLAELTLDTLKQISQFDLEVNVLGSLQSPKIKVNSDLDNQLNKAFKQQVKARWANLQEQTKSKLEQRLKDKLDLNDDKLAEFNKLKQEYEAAEQELSKFSEDKINALIDEKKAKYEKELRDKLKAEEDKLKKEAEEKLKKEKDKLKEKLKNKLKDFGI